MPNKETIEELEIKQSATTAAIEKLKDEAEQARLDSPATKADIEHLCEHFYKNAETQKALLDAYIEKSYQLKKEQKRVTKTFTILVALYLIVLIFDGILLLIK